MTSKRSRIHLLLVCLIGLGFAAACSCEQTESEKAAAEKPAEIPAAQPVPTPTTTPVPAPAPAAVPTIQEQLAVEIEVPDHYPKDAPIYPGSRLSNVEWQGGGVSATFSTSDPAEDVIAFMNDNLASQGWSDLSASEMPDGGSVLQATKSGRGISALVSQMEDGLTLIAISVDP